jgi:dephospho-CoA kinase
MAKIIIGLTGEMACGKGTAAKYAAEKHRANSYRFSSMLRDVLDRLYIEQTRENVSGLSTILRQKFGESLFARVMAEDVKKDENEVIVIDGIRRLADIEYLKKLPEFKLVYIEADIKKCYERITHRGENTDDNDKTFEKFLKEHELETEVQIKDLKNYADFVVNNDDGFEKFYQQIDKIIEECQN